MGDRGNIRLRERSDSKASIYIYSHWNGSSLPELLAGALRHCRERWIDPSYAQRSIISLLTPNHNSLLGLGVSICRTDNEHPVLEVQWDEQRVVLRPDDGWDGDWESSVEGQEILSCSLDEYVSGEWEKFEEQFQ